MDRLLNVLAVLSVVLILFVLRSLRREHIRVEYSVSWLGAALTLLVLSRTRVVLEWLAGGLGHRRSAAGAVVHHGMPFPDRLLPFLRGDF